MSEGSAFGETALFQECKRTASVKSLDHEVELAYLDKEGFNQTLKAMADEALEAEVDFLRNLHSFNDMARKTIIKYVRMCKEVDYAYGQIVYADGEIPKYVYIVKKGEFELIRKLPQSSTANTPRQRSHRKKNRME